LLNHDEINIVKDFGPLYVKKIANSLDSGQKSLTMLILSFFNT